MGLDTKSREEFLDCARHYSEKAGVLIAAGGNGTLLHVMNTVSKEVVLGYLPFGSGNAMKFALEYPNSLEETAKQIRDGSVKELDVVGYNNHISFFVSVGLEGDIIENRKNIVESVKQRHGVELNHYVGYTMGFFKSLFSFESNTVEYETEYNKKMVDNVLTTVVMTEPFYG